MLFSPEAAKELASAGLEPPVSHAQERLITSLLKGSGTGMTVTELQEALTQEGVSIPDPALRSWLTLMWRVGRILIIRGRLRIVTTRVKTR